MAKGSIFKEVAKDGTVSWRIRVDMVDPVTGKRRQPQRTYKTKREAEAGLAQWLVEIERGTVVEVSKMTVGEYRQHWLTTSAQYRVRPSTFESYQKLVRSYILPTLGAVPLQRLTPSQVQAFYATQLAEARKGRTGSGLSPRTVRYLHAILHRALKEALQLGLVARNVTEAVAPPKNARPPIRNWDVADVQRFLAVAVDDHRYNPVWLMALHTGMRKGELLGLRWQDVDLDARVVRVRQALSAVKTDEGYTLTFGEPKTRSGRRTIALDAVCIAALREHRTRQRERRVARGPQWREGDLVFTNEIGGPIDPMNLYHRFIALIAKAGVPRIPFHGLRHTHATLLMKPASTPRSSRSGWAMRTSRSRYPHTATSCHRCSSRPPMCLLKQSVRKHNQMTRTIATIAIERRVGPEALVTPRPLENPEMAL